MSELLDDAVAAFRRMPARERDEIARSLLAMSNASDARSAERDGRAPDEPRAAAEAFRLWPPRRRPRAAL